jgi:hypothetical protein
VIRDNVLQQIKPEKRNLRKDFALVWDGRGHNDVECGETIGGDHEEMLAKVVDVANLPASGELEPRKICFLQCFHCSRQRHETLPLNEERGF